MSAGPPRVSVVVPYYERPDQLGRLLAALDLQTVPGACTEVVIADDGSGQAPRIGTHPFTTTYVSQDDEGFRAAAARNLGARHTTGDVVVFLDQDCVPEPTYLETVMAAVSPWSLTVGRRRHADLRGWDGPRVQSWLTGAGPGPSELPEPRWLLDGYARTADLTEPDDRSYQLVLSAVLSLGRQLLQHLGGFDETFRAYGGEDWELAHRAYVAGADLRHLPDAVVWHDGPDAAGRAADLVRLKNRETLTLARLVPDRDLRGEHLVWSQPDVVVRLRSLGAAAATVIASTESLLAGSDAHVWLDSAEVVRLLDDPRVHVGEPGDDLLARARYAVECEPVLLAGTTLRHLSGSAPVEGDGFLMRATRDVNRAHRGIPSPAPRGLPDGATVTRLTQEPTLERLWQSRRPC